MFTPQSFCLYRSSPLLSQPSISMAMATTSHRVWTTRSSSKRCHMRAHCMNMTTSNPKLHAEMVDITRGVKEHVDAVKLMFDSMSDGEISPSAYDTAWVALIEEVNGGRHPQFPSSLQWIADNQLPDGSWGESKIFLAYDRLLCTLACVVALKYWNAHHDQYQKGVLFLKESIRKLEDEDVEHYLPGFEVCFPTLLELARKVDVDLDFLSGDCPFLHEIYSQHSLKLSRIPMDKVHEVPTTSLYSLEGIWSSLNWEKLLKLQNLDGSFYSSPSSTAFALMQTRDDKCLKYLEELVHKFNGGVPCVYPIDLYERIWAIDRLQRLGMTRYFKHEIQRCLNYVLRYWTDNGIGYGRHFRVSDLDDTSMGFRLLRLHGHQVSPDAFKQFEKDGEFFCHPGQSSEGITVMFNLYRASQLLFPEETILEDAKKFSFRFLSEKQAGGKFLDKWIICKDLPGEVGYALDVPWYASLPRVETRFYIEQYGAEDDVWIAKVLYRFPYVSNNTHLELAKMDYSNCQVVHQAEWDNIQTWYSECELERFGVRKENLLLAYFVAAACVFEPKRSRERIAWTTTTTLVEMVASYYERMKNASCHERRAFVREFVNNANSWLQTNERGSVTSKLVDGRGQDGLIGCFIEKLKELSSSDTSYVHGQGISHAFFKAWEKWLVGWAKEGDKYQGIAELLVQTIHLTGSQCFTKELLSHPEYQRLSNLTNNICHQLGQHYQQIKVRHNGNQNGTTKYCMPLEIDSYMQELVRLVLQNSEDSIDMETKNIFLLVAKSFYYICHCDLGTINIHIAKMLFEKLH